MLQSRDVDRRQPAKVRDANFYFFVEAAIALAISFVINVFVVSVFAHGLFGKTNKDVVSKITRKTGKITAVFNFPTKRSFDQKLQQQQQKSSF